MHCCAARHHEHAVNTAQHIVGKSYFGEIGNAVFYNAVKRFLNDLRLFVDLFKHIVRKTAFLCLFHVPFGGLRVFLYHYSMNVKKFSTIGVEPYYFVIIKQNVFLGIL